MKQILTLTNGSHYFTIENVDLSSVSYIKFTEWITEHCTSKEFEKTVILNDTERLQASRLQACRKYATKLGLNPAIITASLY